MEIMEWRKCYLDVILVPLGVLINIAYHAWLCHKVRTQPLTTAIGTYTEAQRLWVPAIVKDIDKRNIVAVQTLRNTIMGSTMMATTSILLCAGLTAVISSTYGVTKAPFNPPFTGSLHVDNVSESSEHPDKHPGGSQVDSDAGVCLSSSGEGLLFEHGRQ
ncbi:hypothetical protein FH972_008773 [Carpinus fangiana]|uniref:Uncharacterized protein n=1 Tax=Carpinus fangiana TaxID=176857 RepID=A0A5N6QZR5_9ROSI|nr:hypothetical protein FH972_008773 [Carpinus fangiana]